MARNPNLVGATAEAAIAYEATRLGIEVFKPLSGHSRCDLIFDIESALYRVQCKTARRSGEILCVNLVSSWHTPNGYVRHKYRADEVDLVAAYSDELRRCFLLPFDRVAEGRSGIQLRLTPPKNGQRAAIHYAAEYEFSGAVAQLGERRLGMAEATGSSPVSSTPQGATTEPVDGTVVGAHLFRNHFGYYMERAVAGDEILVTRRGRPAVRLVAHQPKLRSRSSDDGD